MAGGSSLLARASAALVALLSIAVVTRVAWELLRPVVPTLVVLVVVSATLTALVRRR